MLRVGVSNIYVRRPGHLLCHIIVPELDHPEEDLGAALGHLATVCLQTTATNFPQNIWCSLGPASHDVPPSRKLPQPRTDAR